MTRRNSDDADEYTTRIPTMHEDVSLGQRIASVADSVQRTREDPTPDALFDRDRDDAGAGPGLTLSITVSVPAHTVWLRKVSEVRDNSGGIRSFVGGYLRINNERTSVRPGTLVLACIHTRTGTERICAYIILPDSIWYQTQFAPIARTHDWHALIRGHLRSWTVLSRVQRVVRACTEGTNALIAAHGPEYRSERGRVRDAIDHFQDILAGAIGDVTDLEPDTVRRSFDGWVREICETTTYASNSVRTREEVLEVLSGVIPETPQAITIPSAEEMNAPMVDALNDLRDTVQPIISEYSNLAHATAFNLLNIEVSITRLTECVDDERRTRRWQRDVMGYLDTRTDITTDVFLSCIRNRELTRALRSSAEEAMNHLRIAYGITVSVEDIESALLYASQEVLASVIVEAEEQPPQGPAADTRQARNIRIGRRRTSG